MTTNKDVERYKETQRSRSSIRRASDFHVLRYVPGTSPVHRIWAGTKILWFTALAIGLLLWPTWRAVGLGAVMILGIFLLARLPRGFAIGPPRWLYIIFGIGAVIAVAAGGAPYLHLGRLKIGLGGLEQFARFWAITIEIFASALVVSWTTPMADLAPALGRLTGPLRRLKVPVDELVGAVGLAIRCLPLLLEEGRIMSAARRSRQLGGRKPLGEMARELEDLIWTALSNALRRSRELAEAIEARGGVPTVAPETHTMAWRDAVLLLAVLGAVGGMAILR